MIPDFQTIMLPMLEILGDQNEHTLQELIKQVSDKFNLTDEERNQLLETGNQAIINNRVGWARTYLKKANLIESPQRATFKITNDGLAVLKSKPEKINIKFLKTLPAFKEWHLSYTSKKDNDAETTGTDEFDTERTPQELIDYSYSKLKDELAFELLEKIKACSPAFFEKLVIDLLIKMGYGGSRKDAGQIVGKSGDGGIDGIIKEDKLGLDVIYVQAKRWENQVTISSVRDFAGSLLSKKAKKGIFITTATFPPSANEYVNSIEHKIILIDGKELAKLMIEYNVGVSTKNIFEIKKIDIDYFEEL